MINMGHIAVTLRRVTKDADGAKGTLREILKTIINPDPEGGQPFKKFTVLTGGVEERVYEYTTFSAFLDKWSDFALDDLRRLFADEDEIRDLLDVAEKREHGGDRKANIKYDNIQLDKAPTGTSKDATLRRLRKDCPELHAEVLAGELSANAAAIQAGFRKRTIQVPADDLEAALEKLRKHYGVKLIWR